MAQDAQPRQVAPRMQILGQFIKDISFENVAAQKGTGGEIQPDIQVQINMDAKKREQEGNFEVSIRIKVESKIKEKDDVLFILELDYAGIFHIENVPEDQLHPFLLIECPRMLFPYVRRIVGDVTRDGGFPPLNLENIDFVQLYRQEMERQQASQTGQPVS